LGQMGVVACRTGIRIGRKAPVQGIVLNDTPDLSQTVP
jgi:hypothetical protein